MIAGLGNIGQDGDDLIPFLMRGGVSGWIVRKIQEDGNFFIFTCLILDGLFKSRDVKGT